MFYYKFLYAFNAYFGDSVCCVYGYSLVGAPLALPTLPPFVATDLPMFEVCLNKNTYLDPNRCQFDGKSWLNKKWVARLIPYSYRAKTFSYIDQGDFIWAVQSIYSRLHFFLAIKNITKFRTGTWSVVHFCFTGIIFNLNFIWFFLCKINSMLVLLTVMNKSDQSETDVFTFVFFISLPNWHFCFCFVCYYFSLFTFFFFLVIQIV